MSDTNGTIFTDETLCATIPGSPAAKSRGCICPDQDPRNTYNDLYLVHEHCSQHGITLSLQIATYRQQLVASNQRVQDLTPRRTGPRLDAKGLCDCDYMGKWKCECGAH